MREILAKKFHIVQDGYWSSNELIAAAILAVLVLILIMIAAKAIKRLSKRINPRKDTIFSHRKNKYKNRIGKKNKY